MPRYLFPALIHQGAVRVPKVAHTATPVAVRQPSSPNNANNIITPLEKNFPHILEKIQALWGYPELNAYFLRLTIDDRGDRDGFPTEVWDDLQILMRLHQDLYPEKRL